MNAPLNTLFTDIHAHMLPGSTDAPEGILVSLTPEEAERVLSHPDLKGKFSVGIHPWDTGRPVDWPRFEEMLRHPAVIAVGECGLDRLKGAPIEVQEEIFRRQIHLAEALGMPMILHVVKALDILLRLRRRERPSTEWVLHGFRGNAAQATQLLNAGLSLSLGPRHNPEVARITPPGRLYRETDSAV